MKQLHRAINRAVRHARYGRAVEVGTHLHAPIKPLRRDATPALMIGTPGDITDRVDRVGVCHSARTDLTTLLAQDPADRLDCNTSARMMYGRGRVLQRQSWGRPSQTRLGLSAEIVENLYISRFQSIKSNTCQIDRLVE